MGEPAVEYDPGPVPEALVRRRDEYREHAAKLEVAAEPPGAIKQRVLAMGESLYRQSVELEAETAALLRQRKAVDAAEHQQLWREAFNAAVRLPEHKRQLAWNVRPEDEAVDTTHRWLDGEFGQAHLLLSGAVGCGKTFAEAAAVKRWTEPGKGHGGIAWLTSNELISAMLHSYDLAAPKLAMNVIVDDIGRETKEGLAEALCMLLEQPGHRRIILSTNHPRKTVSGALPSLFARYPSPALHSRLQDEVHPVWLKGASLRQCLDGW